MLNIINNLKPFIEDNYVELGVREYSRFVGISPPTASKILKHLQSEGILKSREERRYILYRANRESKILRDLSIIYWRTMLEDLTLYLKDITDFSKTILFGSLSKLETKSDSDIDLFIDSKAKSIPLAKFEKRLKRSIQLHFRKALLNKNLKNNIRQGVEL